MSTLRDKATWQSLARHHESMRKRQLRDLFERDPERAARFTVQAAGWRLDYSKHRIDTTTLERLFKLARAC
ncbi:MAG: glucose-6-phosphate isomerase, partial [Oleiagrimonas sp.]|nr:glucose-6-phosphate isomerase [Oleiagrimonas sp.]